MPVGLDDQGLPLGLQLIGQPWGEAEMLNTAYALEKAAGFAHRLEQQCQLRAGVLHPRRGAAVVAIPAGCALFVEIAQQRPAAAAGRLGEGEQRVEPRMFATAVVVVAAAVTSTAEPAARIAAVARTNGSAHSSTGTHVCPHLRAHFATLVPGSK